MAGSLIRFGLVTDCETATILKLLIGKNFFPRNWQRANPLAAAQMLMPGQSAEGERSFITS